MRVVDLIIIYFALGSPFAVYAVTGRRRPLTLKQLAAMGGRFFLWPIVATAYFLKWLISDEPLAEAIRRQRIESLREQMEDIAFGGHSTPALFEFRDMFERYAALTLSLDPDPYSHPLLGLSENSSKLSAACIYRLERRRIEFHQGRARSEFLEFVRSVNDGQTENSVVTIAVEIAELLEDRETITEISKLPARGDAAAIAAATRVIRNAAP
jgi:hypothetical protein